jgi:trk system potassium uptake protein TrkA
MYIIIAGCRKIGSNLAMILSEDNHDVVVIDSDPNNFDLLGSGFNGMTIAGMPIDEDVLRSAGIENADALAAVTNDDNMNVMVSEIARDLFHVPTVITRLYDPERETVFKRMGLTTICPTTLAVDKLKNMLIPPNEFAALDIGGTSVRFRITKPARRLLGKSLSEAKEPFIFGIIRKGRFQFACAKTVIQDDDSLVIPEYADQDGIAACI